MTYITIAVTAAVITAFICGYKLGYATCSIDLSTKDYKRLLAKIEKGGATCAK